MTTNSRRNGSNHHVRAHVALAGAVVAALLGACTSGPSSPSDPTAVRSPATATTAATTKAATTPATTGASTIGISSPQPFAADPPGPTLDGTPAPGRGPSPTPALQVPATLPGEVSRTVAGFAAVPGQRTTLSGKVEQGRDYEVRSACTDSAPAAEMTVEMLDSTPSSTPGTGARPAPVVRFTVPCDGNAHRDIIGQLPPLVSAHVKLPSAASRGYAILAPGPDTVTH